MLFLSCNLIILYLLYLLFGFTIMMLGALLVELDGCMYFVCALVCFADCIGFDIGFDWVFADYLV